MAYDPHRKRAATRHDKELRRREVQAAKRARRQGRAEPRRPDDLVIDEIPAEWQGLAKTMQYGGPL